MNELIKLISEISDVYDDFIFGVINYAKKKPEHITVLINYIKSTDDIKTSDIVKFIIEQPDFKEGYVIQQVS